MKRHVLRLASLFVAFSLLLTCLSGTLPAAAEGPGEFGPANRSPGAPTPPIPISGGLLRLPISGEPTTLDPAQYDGGSAANIQMQVFEGLTQYDQSLNAIPAIASGWSTPDAQVWTFNLRSDVYFHNGRRVKASDFVYSWQRARDGDGAFTSEFDDISAFSAPLDQTFVVTMTAPTADLPLRIAQPFFAAIPSEAAATIGTHPVGSGPFEFVSWTAGSKIVLRRFAGYYDTPAHLSALEYRFFADSGAQWTAFSAGALDVTLIPPANWSAIKADPNVLTSTLMQAGVYGFNLDAYPDARVRKAFQRAIDRTSIAADPLVAPYDPLPLAHGVVSPGKGAYDNSDISIPYDPPAALALLAEAGWTDSNSDGILDNGAGTNLNVVVLDSSYAGAHAVAQRIANNLANIGGSGKGAAVTMTTTASQATVRSTGWYSDNPSPYNDLYEYGSGYVLSSRIHYSSATFDNYLATAQATLDMSARNAAYHSADVELVLTDAAVLPLYYGSTQLLQKSYVRDLRLNGLDYGAIPLKYAWLDLPNKTYLPTIRR